MAAPSAEAGPEGPNYSRRFQVWGAVGVQGSNASPQLASIESLWPRFNRDYLFCDETWLPAKKSRTRHTWVQKGGQGGPPARPRQEERKKTFQEVQNSETID